MWLPRLKPPSTSAETASRGIPKACYLRLCVGIARCSSTLWGGVVWCWGRAKDAIEAQGGGGPTCPRAETVMISLLCLFAFLIVAIFAIKFPTIEVKRIVLVINATLAGVLSMVFVYDLMTSKCIGTIPDFGCNE